MLKISRLHTLRTRNSAAYKGVYAILMSHVVNPELMYKDDFYGFLADRKERIILKIENAMGKKIARDQEVQEEGVFVDNEEEESGGMNELTLF